MEKICNNCRHENNYLECTNCLTYSGWEASATHKKLALKQIMESEFLSKADMDFINHPQHYNQGKYEPIDVIKDWKLDFNLGNVIKYVARADYKDNKLEDLKKAKFYLEHEIKALEDKQ